MLAVQLIKPTAVAAAALLRNADGNAQNAGKYETVPKPISVKTKISIAFECGRKNQAASPRAAVNCGAAKCQRRSRLRSEVAPSTNIPINPAINGIAPIQPKGESLHPV